MRKMDTQEIQEYLQEKMSELWVVLDHLPMHNFTRTERTLEFGMLRLSELLLDGLIPGMCESERHLLVARVMVQIVKEQEKLIR